MFLQQASYTPSFGGLGLKDVELPLGRLNILIGANSSGKSNILDVLRLARELTIDDKQTTDAFAERGGFREVVWGGQTDDKISIGLFSKQDDPSDPQPQSYEAQFVHQAQHGPVFLSEDFILSDSEFLKRTTSEQLELRNADGTGLSGKAHLGYSGAYSYRSHIQWNAPNILDEIRDWAFYRFNPLLMRPPQPIKKEYRLVETGQNLSSVVHTLHSDENPILDEIVDVLAACVPTVKQLSSPIHGDAHTYVALKEESVPDWVGSWGLSDGTLLALALSTALMTPEPPSLIALEAPDTELHPYVMETLAEMLRIASEKTQVIATTHSPYLLDFLPPESFVVVEKIEGATQCKPLKGRKGVKKVAEKLGAGNAWASGHFGGVP